MALTDPPQVKIGTLDWVDTEWAPADQPALEDVQKGRPTLPADGVEWLHWIAYYQDEVPRVCRKRYAGPDAPSAQVGDATVLAVGTYKTKLRRTTTDEAIVRRTNDLIVS